MQNTRKRGSLLRLYRSLMPREDGFVRAFTAHSAIVAAAAAEYLAMMQPGADVAGHHAAVCRLEGEADEVTRSVVHLIRRSFVTPFDRADILKLVTAMDDIVDLMKDGGGRFGNYRTDFTPEMRGMAEHVVQATALLHEAMPLLGDVNRNAPELARLCERIGTLESRGDALLKAGLGSLFADGSAVTGSAAILAERAYDLVEEVLDRCEDASDVIQGIVIEQV